MRFKQLGITEQAVSAKNTTTKEFQTAKKFILDFVEKYGFRNTIMGGYNFVFSPTNDWDESMVMAELMPMSDGTAYITGLLVPVDSHRGKGYAKNVMESLIKEAKKAGRRRIW